MDSSNEIDAAKPNVRLVHYRGVAFAPAACTYVAADMKRFPFSTLADSGYEPSATVRVAALGAVAPLAIAALWESAFAFEAGPLSTWSN
jgi:hypothetical protein